MTIVTYNSKTCIYGNRRNLVVNYTTRQFYFYGCNAFNLGIVKDGLGIREVNKMAKELKADGYQEVSHAHVRDNWYK